ARGALEEAAAAFGAVLAESPDYPEAHLRPGQTLVRLGRDEQAGVHPRGARELVPEDPEPPAALAALARRKGQPDEAERLQAEARRLESETPAPEGPGQPVHLAGPRAARLATPAGLFDTPAGAP